MTETDALLAQQREQRRHVVGALSGLDMTRRWTAVPPTNWTPIAAVHHLALDVERWWLAAIVAGDNVARTHFREHPGGAWIVARGTDVLRLYRAETERSDRVIQAADLDSVPGPWSEYAAPRRTAREIVLHVIAETATHPGQLDVVREAIDGRRWLEFA